MKAIEIRTPGGPEVLRYVDRDVPVPRDGEVLVRNHAIGVNYVDIQHRQGHPYPVDLPLVPGIEGAGTVADLGSGTGGLTIGDRVAYAGYMGGDYAEYTLVPADRLVLVPDEVELEIAAATILQGVTVYVLTHRVYTLRRGDVAVVHAAAGGVGSLLVQIASHVGAVVIGTASTEAKLDYIESIGAQYTLSSRTGDLVAEVDRITGGRGASVVYESIGKATFDAGLACLKRRGTFVLFGQTSGPVPPFDVNRLSGITAGSSRGSITLVWAAGSHYIEEPADLTSAAEAVWDLSRSGAIKARIAGRFPLSDAAGAHQLLESRSVIGKLVLLP